MKSREMRKALEELFGRTGAIEGNRCTGCGGPAVSFASELQRREYHLSGLCRVCQEKIFGPPEGRK